MDTKAHLLAALSSLTKCRCAGCHNALSRHPELTVFHDRNQKWLSQKAIQGFAVGYRQTRRSLIDDLKLKVYVDRKLPKSKVNIPIPRELRVPGSVMPIPIEVEAVGRVRFHSRKRARPASGGSGISHEQGFLGTLGCLLRSKADPKAVYLLSNSHVIARNGLCAAGDNIIQPAGPDGGTVADDTIAKLTTWTKATPGPGYSNVLDAAIAEVLPAMTTARVGPWGFPTGIGGSVSVGDQLKLWGATSNQINATVKETDAQVSVTYTGITGEETLVGFSHQVRCESSAGEGDSGAVVLDGQNRVVGLHFAGVGSISYFTPIQRVFEQWPTLELVTQDPPVTGTGYFPPVRDAATARDVMSRTLWGEARSEGKPGIEAVAAVIVNRTKRGPNYWWGYTIEEVCLTPRQFSCWNSNDPNLAKLRAVTDADHAYQTCLSVTDAALAAQLQDPTNGATHYVRAGTQTQWNAGKTPCAIIGNQVFYNNI